MKYVITGSIGNISKPVAEKLIKEGHDVSIISSKADKTQAIQELGAHALTGSIEDASFLANAFNGADAVYLMIPPKWDVTDWLDRPAACRNQLCECDQES
ncbi:MAG: NAD(P)H-binding protein [Ferruginibacter sp.]